MGKMYSENHVLAVLFHNISFDSFTTVGNGYYWDDIVLFHSGIAVYKNGIYSFDPLICELIFIKLEIKQLRGSKIKEKVIERISGDVPYKRYDTCIEWEDLFFDYGECEIVFQERVYHVDDVTADELYFLFREKDRSRLPFELDE